MKKFALIFVAGVATASLAAPAFACPSSEHEAPAQKTADKDAPKADAKQDAAKADTKAAPAKADAKTTKDTQKKPDEVSSK